MKKLFFLPLLTLSSFLFMPMWAADTADSLFNSYFSDYIRLYPEWAIEYNIRQLNGEFLPLALNDVSFAKDSAECSIWSSYYGRMNKVKTKDKDEGKELNRDIFLWYMKNIKDKEPYLDHEYAASHLSCPVIATINLFSEFVSADSPENAQDFLSLLSKFPQKIEQTISRTKEQAKKGVIPHPEVLQKLMGQLEDFTDDSIPDNQIYKAFSDKMQQSKSIGEKDRISFLDSASVLLTKEIVPKIIEYTSYLDSLVPEANEAPGVWKLKDGDKYYRLCLKINTGTDLSPDQIHNIGLSEVKRIQNELRKLYKELGIESNDTFLVMQGKFWQLMDDPKFYFEDSEQGKLEVLASYNAIIGEVYDRLGEFFIELPEGRVKTMEMPLSKTGGLYAYYQPPSIDNSREGVFYINLVNLPDKPGMRTLTYHEAIPGHHLQITLQQENKSIHPFRNTMFFTSFIEGWALYAEKMCYENNFETDIYSKIAYLQSELFRAIRLVVDTGIHEKRWSRSRAFNYMVENQGWGSYTEIDRYAMWPGQACAYKIGEMKIVELRSRAEKKLKNKYSLKEFNSLILRNGSMPLNLLEKTVDRYIKAKLM